MFVTDNGSLTRDNPKQRTLELREVPNRTAPPGVDPDTGEITATASSRITQRGHSNGRARQHRGDHPRPRSNQGRRVRRRPLRHRAAHARTGTAGATRAAENLRRTRQGAGARREGLRRLPQPIQTRYYAHVRRTRTPAETGRAPWREK